jgi:hypothetical protein
MDKEQQAWERASAKDIEASLEREETTIFERFDEKLREVKNDDKFINNATSIKEFGYQEWCNGYIYAVTGFGNIKSFLRTELEALAKECIGKPIKEYPHDDPRDDIGIAIDAGINRKCQEVIAAFKRIGIEI